MNYTKWYKEVDIYITNEPTAAHSGLLQLL